MPNKDRKTLKLLSVILVYHFLTGPLILAIAFYLGGNVILGNTLSGLFIGCVLLYWFYVRDFIKIDRLKSKSKDRRPTERATLRLLNIYIIISFLIGPLLWALICYWAGVMLWGHISIGLFLLWTTLYWIYGIDYLEVDWLLKIKYGEK